MNESSSVYLPTILLDTNVWLSFFMGNRNTSKEVGELISYANAGNAILAYPASSIKDVYYLIAQELKQKYRKDSGTLTESQAIACTETAWGCVDSMTNMAVAAPIGEVQIQMARAYKSLNSDFEDNLVLASLETSQADFFVTEDEDLFRKSPKGAFSPADMLAYLQAW